MKINVRIEQYKYIMELEGDLLADSIRKMDLALQQAEEHFPSQLLVDCKKLRYLSAAGINLFLAHLKLIQSRKIKLTLCHVNKRIYTLFRLLNLEAFFNLQVEKELMHRFF